MIKYDKQSLRSNEMTYEEKFDLIVNEIVEAKKRSRAGQLSKIFVTSRSEIAKKIIPEEIHEVLLQLQDNEKIIDIRDVPADLRTTFEFEVNKSEYFLFYILDTFDAWYEKYLLSKKSSLENLDLINLLKIYDVVLDIDQQLQIDGSTTIHIPALPQLVRFQLLFPVDSIGNRQMYQGYRGEGIKFLLQRGIVLEQKYEEDYIGYGSIKLTVSLLKFNDFLKQITEEYKRRHRSATSSTEQASKPIIKNKGKIEWSDDFKWDGKVFVFGKFGSIEFKSKDRNHILKVLTEKKGDWATLNELQGGKDSSYVRSTIKQIEDRLPDDAQKHIKIVSTQDEDTIEKPNAGAYRIKYIPQP